MKINLLTVCTNNYPLIYAHKLISKFCSISNLEVIPYCVTDRPNEVGDWAIPIISDPDSQGWWNKVNLFKPGMPEGWNLYLDLDLILLNNFDEEIEWAISQNPNMACVSDAISWMGVKFNSSLMIFKTDSQSGIYSAYEKSKHELQNRDGGDQVWIGPQLSDVLYIDEKFPNLKKSLKFHLAKMENNNLQLPVRISDDIKLIDCSGKPKPHQLEMVPYIKSNWHDIELR